MQFRKIPSLAALVEKASNKDSRAQRELIDHYDPQFRAFVKDYLSPKGCSRPREHAHGIVDVAWGLIFKNLDRMYSPNNFDGWSSRILINESNWHLERCIKWQKEVSFESLKKISSDESGEKEIPFDPPSLVNDAVVIHNAVLADRILTEAAKISTKLHAILCLQYKEGLDPKEIAERRGESYDSIRSFLSRSHEIRELRKRMVGKMNPTKESAQKETEEKNE